MSVQKLVDLCHAQLKGDGEDELAKSESENLTQIRELVEKGSVNINGSPFFGITGLHYACQMGKLRVVKYLISKGATIDAKSKYKIYPIHYAAEFGHLEVLKFLIESGAQFKSWGKYRHTTPLHVAVEKGQFEIVQFLMSQGADTTVKNPQGKLAVDLTGDEKIKKLIETTSGGGPKPEKKKVNMSSMPYGVSI